MDAFPLHAEHGAALERAAAILNAAQAQATEALPFGRAKRTHERGLPDGGIAVDEFNVRGAVREVARYTAGELEEQRQAMAEAQEAAVAPPPETATFEDLRSWYFDLDDDAKPEAWRTAQPVTEQDLFRGWEGPES